MNFLLISNDILNVIVDLLDFLSRTRLMQINTQFLKTIKIYEIFDYKYGPLLTDDILKKYKDIKKLNIADSKVSDIGIKHLMSQLTDLKWDGEVTISSDVMLNLSRLDVESNWESQIHDNRAIEKLNLTYLCVANGRFKDYFNLTNMINLTELNISGPRCSIKQEEINYLKNIIKLNASENSNIKHVNHMTNLKELYIRHNCGVDQNGIQGLNLIKLDADDNSKIYDVSSMTNLTDLSISGKCGISQKYLYNLNLIKLDISFNKNINDVSFMSKLKILHAARTHLKCDNIRKLNLIELNINNGSNDDNRDISNMTNLINLNGFKIR